MQKVKVHVSDLLDELIKNRDKHRQTFLDAADAYRHEAIKVLDQALEEAKKGKRIMRAIGLIEPVDMTREYNQAIGMLQMTIDEHIEITAEQYKNFVMDDWSWSAQVTASNTAYT